MRRTSCFLALMAYAASAIAAANNAVSVHVSWVDWPNQDVRKQNADNFEHYRDSKLEARLERSLIDTLLAADVPTRSNASLIVQINVTGTTIDRSYLDSLYGSVRNRPTEYAGKYEVKVHTRDKTVSRHSDKFSFTATYGSGRTTTAMSKTKVTGLVNDWLAKYVGKKKFRKALAQAPLPVGTPDP